MEASEHRPGPPLGESDEPIYIGNGSQSCHLPSISRSTRCRELNKVQEKANSDMINVKRRYSCSSKKLPGLGTKRSVFLDSKEHFANAAFSGSRASSSASAETGLNVRELPGLCGVSVHPDTAADLDQRSSSSPSDHASETPLPGAQKDKSLEEFSLLRLQTKDGQRPEWTFYPRFSSNVHTYHVGKQCFFNGVFLGNRRSVTERTVDKCLGRKKYDIDPRNGIPNLTPGDNPYMYPEQSKGFHKAGSTLPPVKFSLVPYERKFDTFIPLEPLPQIPTLPFWMKEKANRLKNEIREVEELDNWQPAIPLLQGLLPLGGLKNLQKTV
ncbi:spermatogenesis-associated serine-rich protein 1 isoform X2 [Tamandua tetradactyla]|uniref:spermatogenesis-associated serine-rich protein 1 isoform X2 n=1 Tax=Tamandua tetradactyla TaxID=48850 RepID=UPI004053D750